MTAELVTPEELATRLVLTEEWDHKAETCGHWVRPGPYVRRAEPPTAAEARAAGVEL